MTPGDIFACWFIIGLVSSFEYARHLDKQEAEACEWSWGLFFGLMILAPLTGLVIFGKWLVEIVAWAFPWAIALLVWAVVEIPAGIFKALAFTVRGN